MWEIFEEFGRMQDELDRMFGRQYRRPLLEDKKDSSEIAVRSPKSNIMETESNIIATFEIPGLDKGDINLNVTDDSIEVEAKKSSKVEKKDKGKYLYKETSQNFYRKMPLPKTVDADNAKASYKNGVLKIEVPKKEEKHKKKIQIE
jgi:HSP20 family protein